MHSRSQCTIQAMGLLRPFALFFAPKKANFRELHLYIFSFGPYSGLVQGLGRGSTVLLSQVAVLRSSVGVVSAKH